MEDFLTAILEVPLHQPGSSDAAYPQRWLSFDARTCSYEKAQLCDGGRAKLLPLLNSSNGR